MARDKLTLSLLAFIVVCFVLWAIGGGIPYGYDGIEIYFTYLVGYNAATFPQVSPLVADIAASPDPGAHPYYYTHHPNLLGHLLSQILIRLDVADLRMHGLVAIAVASAGIYVGGRTLRAMAGEAEAIAYVLISALHYVGVLSWTSVLLRALHFVLFWVAIALTDAYLRNGQRRGYLAAVSGWTYVLFLNDYALAPFIFLSQVLLVRLATRSWRPTIRFGLATGVAASVSVLSWLAVLVRELGLRVVLQDIAYTYLARNAGQFIHETQRVVNFYHEHRIVFWEVLVTTTRLPSLLYRSWVSAFTLGHGFLALPIYALVTYVVGHALVGPLGRLLCRWDGRPGLKAIGEQVPRVPAPLAGMLAITTWAALAIVVGRAAAPKTSVLVALTRGSLTHVGVRAGATVLVTGALGGFLSKRAPQGVWPSWSAAFVLGTIAVCALALVPRHPGWLPFSLASCVVAVALLGALSAMQVATDRLRARATDDDSRLDTSVWLGGAFTILSVLMAFDVLSLAEAAATVGDRHPDMLPTLLAVGKALGGGVAAITVVALLFRYRFPQARYARLLVALWPSWLFIVGLGAVSVVFCGVLADLFVARQAATGSLGRQTNVLELILVTGALGSVVLTVITCYLRVLARRDPTDTRRTPLVARLTASEGADRVTLRNFVVATLAPTCAMSVISVGAFATNFIYTYKPALVFLEDSVLAIAAVAAFRWMSKFPATAYRRAAATFAVGLVTVYWISYQGSLAYRYPPTEIGIARALKAETFRNARFVEESMYAAIWYYTRGISYSVPWTLTREGRLDYDSLMFFRDRDAKAADYRRLEYLACVRQHQQPEFFCERWIERLKSLGYELMVGENMLHDKDFMIFRLPRTDPRASAPPVSGRRGSVNVVQTGPATSTLRRRSSTGPSRGRAARTGLRGQLEAEDPRGLPVAGCRNAVPPHSARFNST